MAYVAIYAGNVIGCKHSVEELGRYIHKWTDIAVYKTIEVPSSAVEKYENETKRQLTLAELLCE